MRLAGYGFGSTRPDGNVQRHIRSGISRRNQFENLIIRNNIFDRSVHELFETCTEYESCLPKMEGNTYIQGYGNTFGHYGVGGGAALNHDLTSAYMTKSVVGDETGKVYFVDNIPEYVF